MYLSFSDFSHSYKEKRNLDWHVGLYTFVIMTEDGTSVPKHVGFDICHKWCITACICWLLLRCNNMHGMNNVTFTVPCLRESANRPLPETDESLPSPLMGSTTRTKFVRHFLLNIVMVIKLAHVVW